MLDETFYIDGVSADSVGIFLQGPIKFSAPVPIVEKKHIPGRNGDIIFDTGSYENRSGKVSCFSLCNDVESTLRLVNQYLFGKIGYRRLETKNDPDHFWMARVESGARMEIRNNVLAPYEITFDCKPQRFLKSGEDEISNYTGEMVVTNHTAYKAKPLIYIYGVEPGTVRVGTYKIDVLDMTNSPIRIDCETMDVYGGYSNLSHNVSMDEFPVLVPGDNKIEFSGVSTVTIIPRWWEL
jgi:phage-related protein